MAYPSTPKTWSSGDVLTAAQMNAELRDALLAAFPLSAAGLSAAWTGYTPTLTQSATVTKTVTYAKYQRVGRLVIAQGLLTVTGAGTAANAVAIGLPVTAAASDLIVGSGNIFDVSANTTHKGVAYLASTTTLWLLAANTTANTALGVDSFAAGLASPDAVRFQVMYESAT
jgi:hypothetical protein